MPRRRRLLANPAWVTDTIASAFEDIEAEVPAAWLPKLDKVKPSSASRVSGRLKEYGCGKYGCVFPTLDPNIVMKVTTDDTEAEFATQLSHTLVAPICVHYYATMKLDTTYQSRDITLLWRDSADMVGGLIDHIEETTGRGDEALALLAAQHTAAQRAYQAIFVGKPASTRDALVSAWVLTCLEMARQTEVPELQPLGQGLSQVYAAQHIVFGDVHDGNLGLIHRPDGSRWVVTDPGHVAVV